MPGEQQLKFRPQSREARSVNSTLSQPAYDFQSYLVRPNLIPSDHSGIST